MKLLQIRDIFQDVAGLPQLADKQGQGSLDYFINMGILHLDRNLDLDIDVPSLEFTLLYPKGAESIKIRPVMNIDKVIWRKDNSYQELTKMNIPVKSASTGSPQQYGIARINLDDNYEVGDFKDRLILWKRPDQDLTLEVIGRFHSTPLNDPEDDNWWTRRFPDLVVQAAQLQVEKHYRNTAGVRDHTVVIDSALRDIEDNHILKRMNTIQRSNNW